MSIKFDSISPLPSEAAALKLQQRAEERRQRQDRTTALRREQLLDIAWALIHEVGGPAFNMRQVAQRAGYTPGALYSYFDGKGAILRALRIRMVSELESAVQAVKPPRTARTGRSVPSTSTVVQPAGFDASGPARHLFIAQSLAWWRLLLRDPCGLWLWNLSDDRAGGPTASGPLADHGAADGPGLLEQATEPCVESLVAAGLPDGAATHLRDDVLAYGLGLLMLRRSGSEGEGDDREARFVQTLHRWLDRERLLANLAVAGPIDPVAVQQTDLFGS